MFGGNFGLGHVGSFHGGTVAAYSLLPLILYLLLIHIIRPMDFTWQEPKRRANLKKYGFDFADAAQVSYGPTLTEEDAATMVASKFFRFAIEHR